MTLLVHLDAGKEAVCQTEDDCVQASANPDDVTCLACLRIAARAYQETEQMMELPDWHCARCGTPHISDDAGRLVRGHWYCAEPCEPPLDFQEALKLLPDSLNRTLVNRIRLLLERANREAKLAVALRMKLHEVAGEEVASSINIEEQPWPDAP